MAETTFKEAWGVLQRHAQGLRSQTEPNIDDLLGIVTESVSAYKVCQSRVEAVEKALEAALQGSGAERTGTVAAAPAADAGADNGTRPGSDEDDVPF